MFVSEAQVEARLQALREQRDALDREITDLALYLELGRRLGTKVCAPAANDGAADAPEPFGPSANAEPDVSSNRTAWAAQPEPHRTLREPWQGDLAATLNAGIPLLREDGHADEANRGIAAEEAGKLPSAISENALARRYGKELIEAALEALRQAGRPLHASEILAELTARRFSVPGHDPVAALNTRLWKRSGPGGPLSRLGDAVYALAERESDPT